MFAVIADVALFEFDDRLVRLADRRRYRYGRGSTRRGPGQARPRAPTFDPRVGLILRRRCARVRGLGVEHGGTLAPATLGASHLTLLPDVGCIGRTADPVPLRRPYPSRRTPRTRRRLSRPPSRAKPKPTTTNVVPLVSRPSALPMMAREHRKCDAPPSSISATRIKTSVSLMVARCAKGRAKDARHRPRSTALRRPVHPWCTQQDVCLSGKRPLTCDDIRRDDRI